MSYILDALRKADAERDRGHVPNIHAQSAFGSAAPGAARPAGASWPWVLAAAFGLIAAGAVGWMWYGGVRAGTATAPESRVAVLAPSSVPMNATPPPPAAEPVAPATVPATPVAPIPVTSPPGGMAQGASTSPAQGAAAPTAPTPVRRSSTAPTAPPSARPRAEAAAARSDVATGGASPAATGAATTATATAATATAERIYTLAELPDNVRHELPALGVGGSMYSPTPAARLLIVNGQVAHEGDALAPGVVLRQIRLKSAVLSYRDYRFEIRY